MADLLKQAQKLLSDANKNFDKVETYSALIHCQDRIKKKVHKPEAIFTYFQKPENVYLRWLPGPYKGLQVSRVPARDGQRKFRAREPGLRGKIGVLTLPIDSPIIDKLYPHHFRPHEPSIAYLLRQTNELFEKAQKKGMIKIVEIVEAQSPLLKRPATRVVTRQSENPNDGLKWPGGIYYFDKEFGLPLHFKLDGFDGGMFGEYAFSELKINIDLPDDAFEIKKR